MKIYLFANQTDLTDEQRAKLQKVGEVVFVKADQIAMLQKEKEEKIIALDPDILDWTFSNETIASIPNIKALCLETTGFEWVDGAFCRAKNIAVTNVPKYCSNSVAEQAVFFAMALTKKYPLFAKEGKMNWASQFIGGDLAGKTAGIIGFGAIGELVAQKCAGLGMNILFYDRKPKKTAYQQLTVSEVLQKADYVFFCLAKNEETKKLVDNKTLATMKKSACAITIANALVDTDFLAKQVKEGRLFGAAFESKECDLKKYEGNVFVTPFNAYYTEESLINMFDIWTQTILAASSKNPIHVVN